VPTLRSHYGPETALLANGSLRKTEFFFIEFSVIFNLSRPPSSLFPRPTHSHDQGKEELRRESHKGSLEYARLPRGGEVLSSAFSRERIPWTGKDRYSVP